VQAYCTVFDDQTKRTVSSVQPANWEAISNSEKTWQTTALLPCSLCQKDTLALRCSAS
jgi:hypothetical protein